ncbi:MAG TPA: class I SAM-dependent methyltransferase [Acidimicrobiales bacterium]|nr:class I SAM-dependent methyltransferase [Acidimicrobiales bacterium]
MTRDDERLNRAFWESTSAEYQAEHSAELDAAPLAWGTWRIPESEVGALGDLGGLDVLELGCGGGQWSIALAALGVHVVGLDLSWGQLAHARRAAAHLPLVQGSAEAIPVAADSFDLVFCDHGAMTFADPDSSVPEVARVLRPAGRLVFCNSTLLRVMCLDDDWAVTTTLHRDAFGLKRVTDGESVDFVLPHAAWIRLFRRHGLVVDDLIELRPSRGATTTYPWFASYEWASRWPAEEIWVARKPA